MRIAVDVGGTFTDVIVLDEKTNTLRLEKVETTPQDPADGVLQSFHKARARPGGFTAPGASFAPSDLLRQASKPAIAAETMMAAVIKPMKSANTGRISTATKKVARSIITVEATTIAA